MQPRTQAERDAGAETGEERERDRRQLCACCPCCLHTFTHVRTHTRTRVARTCNAELAARLYRMCRSSSTTSLSSGTGGPNSSDGTNDGSSCCSPRVSRTCRQAGTSMRNSTVSEAASAQRGAPAHSHPARQCAPSARRAADSQSWQPGPRPRVTLLQRRLRQLSDAAYCTSNTPPSLPPRKMRPDAEEAQHVMMTLSDGRLYSGIGCSDSSSNSSPPPPLDGPVHTPSSTICARTQRTARTHAAHACKCVSEAVEERRALRHACMPAGQQASHVEVHKWCPLATAAPPWLGCGCHAPRVHAPPLSWPAPARAEWQTGRRLGAAWPGQRSRWPAPRRSTPPARRRCRDRDRIGMQAEAGRA